MEYSTSSFGVNVGTGLMLESILTPTTDRIDDDREIPDKVELKHYDVWYINLHSFIVNIISAYDKDTVTKILKGSVGTTDMILNKIADELEILVNIIPINLMFFYLGYPKYKLYLNEINNETKVGMIYNTALKFVKLIKNESYKKTGLLSHNTSSIIMVEENGNVLRNRNKGLMTTSNTIDLIHNMPLLEFHTGVLKGRNQFYTKLKTKDPIPFEETLMVAIGDKKNLLKSPLSSKEKKILLDLILKKKMRPYARYNKGNILSLVSDKELLVKLKAIPNIY
jgi:hypothetical protein